VCHHVAVFFRAGALVLMLYRMYRRLPAGQRRRLRGVAARHGYSAARRHGPRVAGAVLRARRPRR